MRRRLAQRPDHAPAAPATASAPGIRLEERPGGPVIRLDGELDEVVVPALADRLAALDHDDSRLVLDLTDVRYLGSAGVRALVELAEGLSAQSRRLVVAAPPGTIARRVLDLSGVAAVLGVVDAPPG
jgi:anti-anti-sigma factor